jgi:pilus assembly protein Flp/PilA
MASVLAAIKQFFRANEEGATTVEYALLVAALAAVIVIAALAFGANIEKAFTTVRNALP